MSKFKRPPKTEPEEVTEKPKPIQTEGKVTLDLINDDIIRGYPRSPLACPLARCGARCIPGVYHVKVGKWELIAFFGSKKGFKKWPLPDIIRDYVVKFDEEGVMVPFSWEIDLSIPTISVL